MAPQIPARPIDKSTWGDGPWSAEPDRVAWAHAGLPCLALRGPLGSWCGYAAVPPGHPLHGTSYDVPDIHVHGGLTYSGACAGPICHVPTPADSDDVWWFGFDCAHAGDFSPALDARLRTLDQRSPRAIYDHARAVAHDGIREVYRDRAYVQAETDRLADQLGRVAATMG